VICVSACVFQFMGGGLQSRRSTRGTSDACCGVLQCVVYIYVVLYTMAVRLTCDQRESIDTLSRYPLGFRVCGLVLCISGVGFKGLREY